LENWILGFGILFESENYPEKNHWFSSSFCRIEPFGGIANFQTHFWTISQKCWGEIATGNSPAWGGFI
jgi:hypothetical protein